MKFSEALAKAEGLVTIREIGIIHNGGNKVNIHFQDGLITLIRDGLGGFEPSFIGATLNIGLMEDQDYEYRWDGEKFVQTFTTAVPEGTVPSFKD